MIHLKRPHKAHLNTKSPVNSCAHKADENSVVDRDPLWVRGFALEAVVVLAFASFELVELVALQPLLGRVDVSSDHAASLDIT